MESKKVKSYKGGLVRVNLNESWYFLLGGGKTVHYGVFKKFTDNLIFIKNLGKVGQKPFPVLNDQVTVIERP